MQCWLLSDLSSCLPARVNCDVVVVGVVLVVVRSVVLSSCCVDCDVVVEGVVLVVRSLVLSSARVNCDVVVVGVVSVAVVM